MKVMSGGRLRLEGHRLLGEEDLAGEDGAGVVAAFLQRAVRREAQSDGQPISGPAEV